MRNRFEIRWKGNTINECIDKLNQLLNRFDINDKDFNEILTIEDTMREAYYRSLM
jgi:hypothetical protein